MTDIILSSSQRGQDVTGRGASEGDRETGDGVEGRGEAEKAFGNMDFRRGSVVGIHNSFILKCFFQVFFSLLFFPRYLFISL